MRVSSYIGRLLLAALSVPYGVIAQAADTDAAGVTPVAPSADSAKPANPRSADSTKPQPVDAAKSADLRVVPEAKNTGGEPDGIVHVANVIYAGFKSSKCFSDHFLIDAEKESAISTSRRFHAVKLASDDVYGFPLLIMTGEGAFTLPDAERKNLRQFVERGGFLLASAGCSSEEWDRSFRREMAIIFPDNGLKALEMNHPVFHTVHDIDKLEAKHGVPKPLEGVTVSGRLGVIYSQDGLNDTANTQGCCCCGGNEIYGAAKINVNILAYALIY